MNLMGNMLSEVDVERSVCLFLCIFTQLTFDLLLRPSHNFADLAFIPIGFMNTTFYSVLPSEVFFS